MVQAYLARVSELADDAMNCSAVLNWLEVSCRKKAYMCMFYSCNYCKSEGTLFGTSQLLVQPENCDFFKISAFLRELAPI